MKKRLFTILLMGVVIMTSTIVIGQDVHFSQYYRSPLIVNPALTGLLPGNHRAVINYREQWSGVAPFTTYGLSYDAAILKKKLKNKYLGVGLLAFKDEAGDAKLSTTQLSISVSSVITLNNKHDLSAGLQGGFAQKSISGSSLQWGAQYEENTGYSSSVSSGEAPAFENYSFGDFSAGLAWSFSNNAKSSSNSISANAGVALHHLNKPEQGFDTEELHMQMTAHAQLKVGIKNTGLGIIPSVLYMNQGPLKEINAGGLLRYRLKEESKYTGLLQETAIYLGGFYRMGDAFIPTFIFEISNYSLGISYDLNTSSFKEASNGKGGFEISLQYINPNPYKNPDRNKRRGLM